jgi:hypothetical protein
VRLGDDAQAPHGKAAGSAPVANAAAAGVAAQPKPNQAFPVLEAAELDLAPKPAPAPLLRPKLKDAMPQIKVVIIPCPLLCPHIPTPNIQL